jgi:uncharacterized repeat protein (TIGR03837 family)
MADRIPSPWRWDIFCTVVDNYGDAGITWRLAHQLAVEHGVRVRLWVDDLGCLQALLPDVAPEQTTQTLDGVEVCRWDTPFPDVEPADVVIEALACNPPDNYVRAMADRRVKPLWINLEHLSAEDWVRGCHGLPSPHPRLLLTKYFFFPGFEPGTGGLLRARGQEEARFELQHSHHVKANFWHGLGLGPRAPDEIRISLFGYENQALAALLASWAKGGTPVHCLLTQSPLVADAARFFGRRRIEPGTRLERGSLTLHTLPWLEQDRYDRLLWACDWNFVRGEDSFMAAQWAGRPLVWQAYRQAQAAHKPKIEAFLNLYCAGLPSETATDLRMFWQAWNAEEPRVPDWHALTRHWPTLARLACTWTEHLGSLGDLATNLVHFCREKL